MTSLLALLALFVSAALAWFRPKLRWGMLWAACLILPLGWLPLLAGNPIDAQFYWQLLLMAGVAAMAEAVYFLTIRRYLTPLVHPGRRQLLVLLIGPMIALVLFWAFNVPLLFGSLLGLMVGLATVAVRQRSLVWDPLSSAVGFGLLYAFLYLSLALPITGSQPTVPTFSGLTVLNEPLEGVGLAFFFGSLWGALFAAFRRPEPEEATDYLTGHHRVKRLALATFLTLLLITAAWGYDQFIGVPTLVAHAQATSSRLTSLTEPLVINFDKPIDREAIKVSLSPSIDGDISFGNPLGERLFVRQLVFTPSQPLAPNSVYRIQTAEVSSILGTSEKTYTVAFETPEAPEVTDSRPPSGQTDVSPCEPLVATLDRPLNQVADFDFQLEPPTAFKTQLGSDQKTYTLTPDSCLAQGVAYALTVNRRLLDTGQSTAHKTISFTTKAAPGVASFTPQGEAVLASTKQISLTFAEPMTTPEPDSFISLQPSVSGRWQWADNQHLVYELGANLTLDTAYTVTTTQDLKDTDGGFLPKNTSFSFKTIGRVQVTSLSPRDKSSGVRANTPIKVTFNQAVDHQSAEQHFSLNPASAGSFSWQGNTLTYSANLTKDTSYQVTINPGIVSLNGLDSTTTTTSSFRTEESATLLNIPVYYQQKALSCEIATLKMALNYRGIGVDESTLIAALGSDPGPRQGNTWADPNETFVGNISGKQNTTGYGVHAAPIARVANQYRSTQILAGADVKALARHLSEGHPVIIWGTLGTARPDSWVTPAGKTVDAWVGEHTRLVVGFTGSVDQPTGFYLNDPIGGRLRWTTSQLQANWGRMWGMGVVVY